MVAEMITLDGYPLTGRTREGEWKRLGELEGWFDSPEPKRDRNDRVNGDGTIDTEIYFESRLITFNGRVRSKSHDYLHEAALRLTALPGRGGKKLLVRGHGPTQWARVDPRGKVKTNFDTDNYLSFQIPLESTDPFKYGEVRSFQTAAGDSIELFHRGTVHAWPVITITGSMPGGYELTLNGRVVTVTKSLASGSTHTLDMRTGILRENGDRVYKGIEIAEYFAVNPGEQQNFWPNPLAGGSGTFNISLYDTFI
ncbi:phage tail domain-containing protein [Glutamicibacter sp.]|uniref:phage tail domain-containing protein n=1 Tax=Glutamicibacter sp. TaxID=1931995 RepID=UPI0028BDE925|nr:phage tail domain-containing protein [Glutamicibacter sp.]